MYAFEAFPKCGSSEFECEDHRCIPDALRCDGKADCDSDEQDCGMFSFVKLIGRVRGPVG